MAFAMMDDVDVKFWSTSLLLNLSMSADILKEEIVKEDGVGILIDLAISDTDEPQIAMQAAKTLIMLGFIGKVNYIYYMYWLVVRVLRNICLKIYFVYKRHMFVS